MSVGFKMFVGIKLPPEKLAEAPEPIPPANTEACTGGAATTRRGHGKSPAKKIPSGRLTFRGIRKERICKL